MKRVRTPYEALCTESLHTVDCAKSLYTVDCSESLHTVDCTRSLYIVEKETLKVSTPQKSLRTVEKSLHCRKVFTLTALNKNKQKSDKKVFLS